MAELESNFSGIFPEAGCDEAGRGCLAGPVAAAAVILSENFYHDDLNDSKQLSASKRTELKAFIEANAISWAVAWVSQQEIDRLNILNSSILAMHRAIEKLTIKPEFIIADGNKFKPIAGIPYATIVKGDARYMSIAAASILAKTHRDLYMEHIHNAYPHYHWKTNKGYPTSDHRDAILKHGYSEHHRLTFHLKNQMRIQF